jgi:transposase-like protein
MSKKRRTFTPAFKFQVVMEYLSGEKRRVEILREHKLSDSTLERWCNQLKERGPQVFAGSDSSVLAEQARRIAELERVIGQLTVELAAAKKVSNWLNSR